MPTINEICTSVPNTPIVSNFELPFIYSEIFQCESPIHFSINLNYLNKLRSDISLPPITSSNINNNTKSLVVFLCTGIDGSNNFTGLQSTKIYNLQSLNLQNNFLFQNLSGSTSTFGFTHYDFGLMLTQQEILSLHKSYKLIFRITDTGSPNTSTSSQNGDIIQDFILMLNTSEYGPYEPQFDYIDYMDPRYLNSTELNDIRNNCTDVPGKELSRVYYPKNIQNLNALPISFFCSGTWHNALMYDTYASLLASYGYFVIIPSKVASTCTTNSLRILQLYDDKIANGKFFNKLDYSRLYFSGHSLGGVDAFDIYNKLLNNETIIPSIPDIDLSYIKSVVNLEPAGSLAFPATVTNLTVSNMSSVGSYSNGYQPPDALSFIYKGATGLFHFTPTITNGSHEDVAFTFSAFNDAAQTNNNVLQNVPTSFSKNEGQRKYNSNSIAKYKLAESVLIKFAIDSNPNLIKWYYNTNYTYLPNILYLNTNVIDYYYRVPDNNILLIEGMTGISGFSSQGFSGITLIRTNVPSQQLYNTSNVDTIPSGTPYNMRISPLYCESIASFANFVGATYPRRMFFAELSSVTGSIEFNKTSTTANLTTHDYITVPSGAAPKSLGNTFINGETYWFPPINDIITQHFGLFLEDINLKNATISSHQNNKGIEIPLGGKEMAYVRDNVSYAGLNTFLQQSRCVKYINFKLSDFKNKNPDIDLSQISKIKILFDPLYGTTGGFTGSYCINTVSLLN
jgi:hypothetical protein